MLVLSWWFAAQFRDGRGNQEFREQQEKDKEVAKKKEVFEELFTQQRWDDCQAIFQDIATDTIYDFMLLVPNSTLPYLLSKIKGGLCFTFGSQHNVSKGETYLRQTLSLNPGIPSVYSIYGHNLLRQGKFVADKSKNWACLGLLKPIKCVKRHSTPLLLAILIVW